MSRAWSDTAMHVLFDAQGLATMGVCPTWDRAVHNFVAADVLARAHEEFGPLTLNRVDEDLERERVALEARYGEHWRNHPDGKPVWKRLVQAGEASDSEFFKQFYAPFYAAQCQLARTPAPTLAAALFKAAVIEAHDVWNDPDLEESCIDLIQADLARLASQEGCAL